MKAPEDLLKIYKANVNAFFTGSASESSHRKYSIEEISHITYFKLQDELSPPDEENKMAPLLYTKIIGPIDNSEIIATVKYLNDCFPEIHSLSKHKHLLKWYIIIVSFPWISSLIESLPKDMLPLLSDDIYRLSLDNRPAYFPCELFLSKAVSHTLCIINIQETEETLLNYFHEYSVEKAVSRENRAYLKIESKIDAKNIYIMLSGKLINSKCTFLYYYPDILSNINIFL
ncbi:hypothetical protein NEPAR06_1693 [Nematocida parisii]|uniref:Uncharacterized protein n=1 Tax=Nematocida parisii (strain ERTm3) TaxID=935791 RepID=I3EHH2_NEMP3|nr:uncharacterized protein NEPG_00446 [Nematocida parisii ERTm1]EIJ88669.1 hypothetical protein NEQG_01359 [Nematocida parisii ERTm3]KAI5130016.1 hypothetical protein NEPAR03_1920 [Nematocida parisii]EIJ94921.1 hypothetical protein NEPG_00446 [Nematocida parisii ERTm1]KAI5130327.1 hypothetical protein NEPAR08_1982 [Nematocida parisii]KAI5143326.1 hypothetical protein NEPAR04_1798 [Nematocida parisii]|eukprot:XP_013058277.1 hypothetical protein NEPG_00446 [Nematocida parisii ERTm1]